MIKQPKDTVVRVTSEFFMAGEVIPVDTVIRLETPFALELVSMNRAELTNEEPRNPRKPSEQAKPKKPKAPGAGADDQE